MKVIIPIHSVIDVITNSSTEIFTNASSNSPKLMKDVINSILQVAGCDKTADDLFDIELKTVPSDIGCIIERAEENEYQFSVEPPDYYDYNNWSKHNAALETWYENLPDEQKDDMIDAYGECDYESPPLFNDVLIVKSKDGTVDNNMTNTILEMLDQDAWRNG